jgi:hypothetical protein
MAFLGMNCTMSIWNCESRNDGILECWNNGIKQFFLNSILLISEPNIPFFHHSIIPVNIIPIYLENHAH